MGPVWMRALADLRERKRAVIALALIAGLGSGLVMAAAAGARRTDSALDRFREELNAANVILPNSPGGTFGFAELDFDVVERLPQVKDSARFLFPSMIARTEGGLVLTPVAHMNPFIGFASLDGKFHGSLNRYHVIEGRRADEAAHDEVVVSTVFADAYEVGVGEVLDASLPTFDDIRGALSEGAQIRTTGPKVRLRVVGVMTAPGELPPGLGYPTIHATTAFARRYVGKAAMLPALAVQLHRSTDIGEFRDALEREAVVAQAGAGAPQIQMFDEVSHTKLVRRATDIQALALWLIAIAGAAAVVLVVGQALTRQAFLGSYDHTILSALGMVRAQVAGGTLIRSAITGGFAAILGAALAYALSPLTPIGVARQAEVHPGLRADMAVLGFGAMLVVLGFVVIGSLPAWLSARPGVGALRVDARRRTSVLGALLARLSPSPGAAVGTRLALEPGRGPTAVPVRSTFVGIAIGIASLIGASAFGASFAALEDDREAFGWTWDGALGNDFDRDLGHTVQPLLAARPDVSAYSAGTKLTLQVAGVTLPVMAVDPLKGVIAPQLLAGRAPVADDEIVLGTSTMRQLDVSIGDTVRAAGRSGSRSFRIVGRAVIPSVAASSGVGEGGITTFEAVRRLVPGAVRNLWLYRVAPGGDREAVAAAIAEAVPTTPLIQDPDGLSLLTFGEVDRLPFTLAMIVAVFAAATLAHALWSAVRRRRRDLAILKTLGFVRRQVRQTVAWQASTLAVVGLVLGIPAGIAGGRWAWTVFASQQGLAADPVVSILPILIVVPATILLANAIAAVPARTAAHTHPAIALRAE